MTPFLACTSGPPSASLLGRRPSARSTTAGPAISTCEFSAITEKCEATRRAAGSPATAPSPAEATGTLAIALATEAKRGGALTGVPTVFDPVPATLPPAPWCSRTSGTR